MKLFLISQTENDKYDTYDSAIVAASHEDEAKGIHPSNDDKEWGHGTGKTWCSGPHMVVAKYIGEAAEGIDRGVILASFNAG